jgi:hypothetical protein
MSLRRLFCACAGVVLVVPGMLFNSGCSDDGGQPARESISAPRKGAGPAEDPAPKGKDKGGAASKRGGKLDL